MARFQIWLMFAHNDGMTGFTTSKTDKDMHPFFVTKTVVRACPRHRKVLEKDDSAPGMQESGPRGVDGCSLGLQTNVLLVGWPVVFHKGQTIPTLLEDTESPEQQQSGTTTKSKTLNTISVEVCYPPKSLPSQACASGQKSSAQHEWNQKRTSLSL